jgi:hypothetical protein
VYPLFPTPRSPGVMSEFRVICSATSQARGIDVGETGDGMGCGLA